MHIEENNSELLQLTELLIKEESIILAIVFGSLAKGIAKSNSDIDIAIKTKNPLQWHQKMA